MNLQKFKY